LFNFIPTNLKQTKDLVVIKLFRAPTYYFLLCNYAHHDQQRPKGYGDYSSE